MDVGSLLEKVPDNISVGRAFGAPYEADGTLVIPVAMVFGGGGGGTSQARPEGRPDSGGGFGGLVLPAGVYVVKGDNVRWVPAVDVTILALASLSLARMLARGWRRRRK